jgi:hypothetical protein
MLQSCGEGELSKHSRAGQQQREQPPAGSSTTAAQADEPQPQRAGRGFREARGAIARVCCHQGVREIRLPHFTQGNG